jgi:hypothetical protein
MKFIALLLFFVGRGVNGDKTLIAGYQPSSDVEQHNDLDQDVRAIEKLVGLKEFDAVDGAMHVIDNGAYSRSRQVLTIVGGLSADIAKNTKVTQVNGDVTATGTTYYAYSNGDTEIDVKIDRTLPNQCRKSAALAAHTAQLGTAPNPVLAEDITGCFVGTNADITVGSTAYTISDAGDPKYRNLKGFSVGSKGGAAKMAKINEQTFDKFKTWYSNTNMNTASTWVIPANPGEYGYQFVKAANDGTTPFNKLGGPDDDDNTKGMTDADNMAMREQGIKKGAKFIVLWMYTVHEMWDAVYDCDNENPNDNGDAVKAWDEAVAFYTGQYEGTKEGGVDTGAKKTHMLFNFAKKRCKDFTTCKDGSNGVSNAKVNIEIFDMFEQGLKYSNVGKCHELKALTEAIVQKMTIPLIQGVLKYSFEMDIGTSGDAKALSEGYTFAAGVVPMVAHCDIKDAKKIWEAIDIRKWGDVPKAADKATRVAKYDGAFPIIKKAFENNYACLNVTCTDIGAYTKYVDEKACTFKIPREIAAAADDSALSTTAIIIIAAAGAAAVLMAAIACYCKSQKDQTVKMYNDLKGGKA